MFVVEYIGFCRSCCSVGGQANLFVASNNYDIEPGQASSRISTPEIVALAPKTDSLVKQLIL
jgi:hypothetical protein